MGEIYILWTDWSDNGTWKADFPTLSTLLTSSSSNRMSKVDELWCILDRLIAPKL